VRITWSGLVFLTILGVATGGYAQEAPAALNLVPLPRTVNLDSGSMALSGQGRVLAAAPRLTVMDSPAKPYRGVMIDVARRHNSIEDLRKCVVLCRLYKVRYMHLHLSDDHAWTFPSTAFPKRGSSNRGFEGPAPKVYNLADLKDLVRFPDRRGITLIPEMGFPGT
jgi:N-acetyl-beta-hexosaminidase